MSFVTVFNTSDRPITVDSEGREVGGREWGTADSTFAGVKGAFDVGTLIKAVIPAGGDVNPLARAADDRTQRLAGRHAALTGLDPKALDAARQQAELGEDLTKTELVRALSHREDVAVAASAPAPKKES